MSQVLLAAYGTPAAPFAPTDIAGLKLWLRAGSLSLSDGDPVSSWTDLSGNANHAVQASGTKQPLFKTAIINGKDVVRFDGVDDVLVAPTPIGPPCSCFVVCTPHGGAEIAYSIYVLTAGIWISQRLSGVNWGSFMSALGEQNAGEDLAEDVPTLLEQTCNSPSPTILYRNGVQKISTADIVASGAATNVQIGADDPASRWVNGDIAEVVLYDTVLSGVNRALVEGYLMTSYGL